MFLLIQFNYLGKIFRNINNNPFATTCPASSVPAVLELMM
jgi:hypothetical protein